MKGWRERAADIFAKHGEIASKMKFAPGPDPSDSPPLPTPPMGSDPMTFCWTASGLRMDLEADSVL